MKKWISGLVFLFSMQAFSVWAVEYKVIDAGDRGAKSLESVLKKHAIGGWKLKEIVYRSSEGTMMIVFEK